MEPPGKSVRFREPRGLIVSECLQTFKRQVASLQLPLVVLLEQQRSDEPGNGGLVGEDPDDVRTSLDLRIEPLQRVGLAPFPWTVSSLNVPDCVRRTSVQN